MVLVNPGDFLVIQ